MTGAGATGRDRAFRELVEAGATAAAIARALGLSRMVVRRRLRELGLVAGTRRARWTAEMVTVLLDGWNANVPIHQIAAACGVARSAVVGKASLLGLGPRPVDTSSGAPASARNGWSDEDDETLARLVAARTFAGRIAATLGRSVADVARRIETLGLVAGRYTAAAERGVGPAASSNRRPRTRRCLGCGSAFPSSHAGNRLCDPCGVRAGAIAGEDYSVRR